MGVPVFDIGKVIADLIASVSMLESQLGELQKQLQDADEQLKKATKDAYDKGFADGKASVTCDPEKQYTQEDMDNAVKGALSAFKNELKDKLLGLLD